MTDTTPKQTAPAQTAPAQTSASQATLPSQSYRSAQISGRKTLRFTFAPDVAGRRAIAVALNLLDLPEFSFKGEMVPQGRADIMLRADLTALVVQPCSVSLAPVKSRLSDSTLRRYIQDFALPDGDEVELGADDSEALPESIDVAAVAIEALALTLPLYPRARGAEFSEASFAAPGVEPLKSADLKPFAGLADLAQRMKKPGDTGA